MRLSRKYHNFLFAFFMALAMGITMSFALTAINVGFVPNFFWMWMKGFAIGSLVAFPVSLLVVPIVQKLVDRLSD